MKKLILGVLSLTLLAVIILPGMIWAAPNAIEIATAEQLNDIRNNLDGDYVLVNDIDLSGTMWGAAQGGNGWVPVGTWQAPFTGTFDGNWHTITGLYINQHDRTDVGLFGYADNESIIGKVRLLDVDVTGNGNVGSLVGLNYGAINYCYVTGAVMSDSFVGGLVGDNAYSGNITGSFATCSVTGDEQSFYDNEYIGGLVGINDGPITASYATGTVTGDNYIGGLVGHNSGPVTASYATGDVRGVRNVGGLTGYQDNVLETGIITACYAAGYVVGSENAGGLVGWNDEGSVIDSYYNTASTGRSDTGKGVPKTSAEMIHAATYSSWDFIDRWSIGEGVTYPYLKHNAPAPFPGPPAVAGVEVHPSMLTLPVGGEPAALTAAVLPIGALDTRVAWSSDNPSVALVDDNGTVTPVGIGEATITATTYSGGFTDHANVRVKSKLTINGTFTVDNKIYDGTSSAEISGCDLTLTGIVGTDDVVLNPVAVFNNGNAGSGKTVRLSSESWLSGAQADLYALSFIGAPTTTADITTQELTITGLFGAMDKEYDGMTETLIPDDGLSLKGVCGADDVRLNPFAAFTDPEVGTEKTVILTSACSLKGTKAGNYTLSMVGAPTSIADITPKELIIGGAFSVLNKVYDGTTSAVIVEDFLLLEGVIGSDDVSLNAVAAFSDPDVGIGKTVSLTSASSLGGTKAGNYNLSLAGAPTTIADITAEAAAKFLNRIYNKY